LANYRQTGGVRFRMVEDNLVSLRLLTQENPSSRDAAVGASANGFLNLANDRYMLGIDRLPECDYRADDFTGKISGRAVTLRLNQMNSTVQFDQGRSGAGGRGT